MDSYKGCLSQTQANEAASAGILDRWADAAVTTVCMSDGGEGWTDAFASSMDGEMIEIVVHDALMRPVKAHYLKCGDTAIVEIAQSIGLSMIESDQRNPLRATSYGVGEMIADAITRGCKKFLVGLGGSATSDAGLGMLRALTDRFGKGKHFNEVAEVKSLSFYIGTDVTNPLCGNNGAAAVFGPQKGATSDMIRLLDRRAATLAQMAAKQYGYDYSCKPGAGAAGGLGYAFMQFLGAKSESGAELMMRETGFDKKLKDSSLVITGEGNSDGQTLMGKMPYKILCHAMKQHVPVYLLSGRVSDATVFKQTGFADAISVSEGLSLDEAMQPDVAINNIRRHTRHVAEEFDARY